jgi:F-type H+-transporting ATPase subunit gamma
MVDLPTRSFGANLKAV